MGYFSSLGTAMAVMAVMVGTVISLNRGSELGETDGLLWFSVSMIICRVSRLASPRTASKATMCSSLVHAYELFTHLLTHTHTRDCLKGKREVKTDLMSGYLETSVDTSRNSRVGSVSLNTSAIAEMEPHSQSVSSP